MLKRIAVFTLLLGFLGLAAAEVLPPDVLTKNTTNEVVQIVKQDKDLKNGHSKRVYDLVETKVLPHFDFAHMTRLAMGKNWNKASPEQQAALVQEFRALLVRTYSAAITSVADYKIDFKPLRMRQGETDVTVNTVVSKSGGPPVTIDYRLELQDAGWKVYDVLVDNVSLVTVYRNSFNSEIRKNGVDGLIQSLSRRNASSVAASAAK